MTTTRVGLTVGFAGIPASVSAGLSFSQDTYLGVGTGGYLGGFIGARHGDAQAGVNATIGVSGYGQVYGGVGVGASAAGVGVGLSTNFKDISASAGLSVGGLSVVGASISTGPSKGSLQVGPGSSSFQNEKAGSIQTESSSESMNMPILPFLSVSYGRDFVRYWSSEHSSIRANGSLYSPKQYNPSLNLDNTTYDTYRLLDPKYENSLDHPSPDYLQGGSFSDYDNYNVVAQGLGGSIRPYGYQVGVYSKNQKASNGTYTIRNFPVNWDNKPLSFRFINDFSNQYRQSNAGDWEDPATGAATYPFDTNPSYGNADGNFGYDAGRNYLAGSKHIEWFTNSDVANGVAKAKGFIECEAKGFARSVGPQVGGFMITNSSGVTYHFALPALTGPETIVTEKISRSQGTFRNRVENDGYAYTWYLTAVTGPDFVDRNNNGIADPSDWGYWVVFNYGKWTDGYQWRNPTEGYRYDVDARFKTYSTGTKEIFYLNSIKTRTHTALFEKEVRADGKSFNTDGYDLLTELNIPTGTRDQYTGDRTGDTYFPRTSLRLNKIYLLNNADVPADLETASSAYDFTNRNHETVFGNGSTHDITYHRNHHYGRNVLDKYDVTAQQTQLNDAAIRIIRFNYDYSLAPETPNSYDESGQLYLQASGATRTTGAKLGKLTLNSVSMLGAHGAGILPDTKFYYDIKPEHVKREAIAIASGENGATNGGVGYVTTAPSNRFLAGEIIRFPGTGRTHYATVLAPIGTSQPTNKYRVRFLLTNPPTGNYTASTTKNPPFVLGFYDSWGLFKSDLDPAVLDVNGDQARKTTMESAQGTDAWSLRRIVSPTGALINIDFESDTYGTAVYNRPEMLVNFGINAVRQQTFYASLAQNSKTALESEQGKGFIGLTNLTGNASALFKSGDRVLITGVAAKAIRETDNNNNYVFRYDPNSFRAVEDIELSIKAVDDYLNGVKVNRVEFEDPNGLIFSGSATTPSTNFSTHLIIGHLSLQRNPNNRFGGGLRVKSIAVTADEITHKTKYEYVNGNKSSGTTSFEPGAIHEIHKAAFDLNHSTHPEGRSALNSYRDGYYRNVPHLLAIAREIPAPGVMYEYVAVKEEVQRTGKPDETVPGYVQYQHVVLRKGMVDIAGSNYSSTGSPELRRKKLAIKDYTAWIGNLKRTTQYTSDGKKLAETVNHFVEDRFVDHSFEKISDPSSGFESTLAAFNYQGVVQESFGDARSVLRSDGQYDIKITMSKHDAYPSIQTGSTSTDYRTGKSESSQTLAFDFYSGSGIKEVVVDGYGNRMMTETTPAYRLYPAMGPKVSSSSNRHMLTQEAGSRTYKVNADNTPVSLVAASVQTWSDQVLVIGGTNATPQSKSTQPGVWRPWAGFAWMPALATADGLTPLLGTNSFSPFNYANPSAPAFGWKPAAEVTLYNPFTAALEAKDINGSYASTKMGYNATKVIVSGGPARYEELAYSGAEDGLLADGSLSGGIRLTYPGGGPTDTEIYTDANRLGRTHTGRKSLLMHGYKHGFSYEADLSKIDVTKHYRATMWSSRPEASLYYWVDGRELRIVTGSANSRANGWYRISLDIPPIGAGHSSFRIGSYNNSSSDVYVDDFRFQPANAQAAAYVYDTFSGQVSDVLDNDNFFTHYDYDAAGKLRKVSREKLGYDVLDAVAHNYHYANAPAQLDNVRLNVIKSGRTIQVRVELPIDLAAATVTYNTGTSNAFSTATGATFSHTYANSGTYWVKVKVMTAMGKVRELSSKVVL
jgi:hypothetical protein